MQMVDSTDAIVGLGGLVDPDAVVTRLATGGVWVEGAVWIPARRSVRWSDIPGNRILEYSLESEAMTVYQTDVEFTNGRTLDHDGSVIQCSHGRRQVERDVDGVVTPIVSSWNGVRFNSPNDVVVASDGSIWFTDPDYGITVAAEGHPGELEYGDHYVFRHDPASGETTPVIMDMEEPNGLAFSPDGQTLYVSDTSAAGRSDGLGNHHIRAYDVRNGLCKNGRVFAVIEPGLSDGIRVDVAGNVWTSSANGIHVYDPSGAGLGFIPVPEVVANLCFGGDDGTDLFIVATTSLYHVPTLTSQARQSPAAATAEEPQSEGDFS
jgi:gluconolactonase